jgi:hypothetical protein
MIKMTAIVSSIVRLLGAGRGAVARSLSNWCATSPAVRPIGRFPLVLLSVVALGATAEVSAAQDPAAPAAPSPSTSEQSTTSTVLTFLGGGAIGLAAHESGHLLFDAIFDAHPSIKKVDFHGIPFFAITHESGLSDRKEFVIDSAGFWVQEATNEWILVKRPGLRHESAPLLKGVFAFNVGASFAYAGAAFARTGPPERDTRGMADALNWKEPYVGLLILVPAVLDAVRFYNPDAKWAAWGSRAAKIGGVLLIVRP